MPNYYTIAMATANELSGAWTELGGASDILDAIRYSDSKSIELDNSGGATTTGEFNCSVSAATNIRLGTSNPISNPPLSGDTYSTFASLPAGLEVQSCFIRLASTGLNPNQAGTVTVTPTKDGIACGDAVVITYTAGVANKTPVWEITPPPTNLGTFFAQYGLQITHDIALVDWEVGTFYVFGTYELVNYAVDCSEAEVAPGTTAFVCKVAVYETTPPAGYDPVDADSLKWWNLGFYWLYQPYSPGPGWTEAAEPDDYGWWQSFEEFAGGALVIDEGASAPKEPRTYTEIDGFDTSGTLMGAGGAVTYNNKIVYARGGYNRGADEKPSIGIFDGISDRTLVTIPNTSDGNLSYAVMSVQTVNGSIYVCTYDPGATEGTSDDFGRIFKLDVDGARLEQVGADFPDEEIPYAVTWHNGRLWCVTHIGDDSFHTSEKGKLYSMLPDYDTTWTEEYDFASQTNILGGTWLLSYKGLLYIGTTGNAGTVGKVFARAIDGTISESLAPSLTLISENNGFLSACVYKDNLYAAYYESSTPAAVIYKFDGTDWTAPLVLTVGEQVPYVGMFTAGHGDNAQIYAVGAPAETPAVLYRSTDGTTWDNVSHFLPGDQLGIPMFAEVRF